MKKLLLILALAFCFPAFAGDDLRLDFDSGRVEISYNLLALADAPLPGVVVDEDPEWTERARREAVENATQTRSDSIADAWGSIPSGGLVAIPWRVLKAAGVTVMETGGGVKDAAVKQASERPKTFWTASLVSAFLAADELEGGGIDLFGLDDSGSSAPPDNGLPTIEARGDSTVTVKDAAQGAELPFNVSASDGSTVEIDFQQAER